MYLNRVIASKEVDIHMSRPCDQMTTEMAEGTITALEDEDVESKGNTDIELLKKTVEEVVKERCV